MSWHFPLQGLQAEGGLEHEGERVLYKALFVFKNRLKKPGDCWKEIE